jgi:predicted Zn-dependent protease
MRGFTVSLSKKSFPEVARIAKVCWPRHLDSVFLILILSVLVLAAAETDPAQERIASTPILDEKDIAETITSFKTADAAKSVEIFRKKMPRPVLDPTIREGIIDHLPPYVAKLQIDNDSLIRKVKQLIAPVLSVYGREKTYDLIIVQHPTPLLMSDSGVVIVITTGMLNEVTNDDELLGLIAHEVGHEYFAQYSIYTRYLLQKVKESGNEMALIRNLSRILMLLELQCDAFASTTLSDLGYDPLAFVDCLERIAKKFPDHSIAFHPSEDIRRRVVAGLFPVSPTKLNNITLSILNSIKIDIANLKN